MSLKTLTKIIMQIHNCSKNKHKKTKVSLSFSFNFKLSYLRCSFEFFDAKQFRVLVSSSCLFLCLSLSLFYFCPLKLLSSSNGSFASCNLAFVNVPSPARATSTLHSRIQYIVTNQWTYLRCWRQSSNIFALLRFIRSKVEGP